MAGEGTTYTIDIDAPIDSAEAAAASVAKLSERLTAAQSAAAQAAQAVKAGEASFKASEAAADRAAKSLEKMNIAIDAQRAKVEKLAAGTDGVVNVAAYRKASDQLAQMTVRQQEAARVALKTKAAMLAEAAALEELDAAASKTSKNVENLEKAHEQAKKASDAFTKAAESSKATGDLSAAGKAMKKLGGPLGQVADTAEGLIFDMKDLAGAIGAVGAAAVGVALVVAALAAAIVGVLVATSAWAVKMADAARSSALLSQGIAKSVDGGGMLEESIGELSKRLPQTRDELRNMAADLAKSGLEGKELRDKLAETAEEAARLKWGPDFKKQTISLNKLATRFGDNISDLFGSLRIEGLLEGLSKLADLFDKNSVTGKALKSVFESLFQPLIDGVTNLIPKIIAGFIQLQIWLLKALIAIKPYGSEILTVIQVLGVLAAIVVGVFVAALAVGIAIAVTFWTIMLTLGKAMQWVTEKFFGLGASIKEGLAGISLEDIGKNLIAGLVGGIAGAGPSVIKALTGVVGSAVDAAKSALGIASPSKVFAEIGMQTAAGMATGVEGATGEVKGALESMVAPPDASATVTPAATGASGGGHTFNITINGAGGNAEEIGEVVHRKILEILEGGGTQAGMAVADA